MAQRPMEQFEKSVKLIRQLAEKIGCNVIDPNYRITLQTVISIAIMTIAWASIFYSFWRESPDVSEWLKIFPILMTTSQGLPKLWSVIFERHRYAEMLSNLREILEFLDQNKSNEKILLKWMKQMYFWERVLIIAYRIALFMIFAGGILYSCISRARHVILEWFLPFVDETTLSGFLIIITMQLVNLQFSARVFPAWDSFFLLMIFPVGAFTDVLRNEINELNSMLEASFINQKETDEKVLRICRIHQLAMDFQDVMDKHYAVCNWVVITANMFGMVCSIFVAYIYGYLQGIGAFFTLFCQVTQNCILGAFVSVQNEYVVEYLYNISWYKLKREHRNNVALMLHRAQHATELTLGGIKPMNLGAYVEVMKTIYTYVTILITVLET